MNLPLSNFMARNVAWCVLIFLAGAFSVPICADDVLPSELNKRMTKGEKVVVVLRAGEAVQGKFLKFDDNDGALVLKGRPSRRLICSSVQSLTFFPNPYKRSFERSLVGGVLALGTLVAGGLLSLKSERAGIVAMLSSPFVGFFAARKLVPRIPETVGLICG